MISASPRVSVVIPTYDRLPLLREAVASVRAQTWADWELIVVDDGSADGTAEWMEGVEDPRVRLLRRPHSGSPAAARNAGVEAARGEYVAFLDSDDVWEPEKLEVQLARLAETPCRWSYTAFAMMDAAGRPIPFRAGAFRAVSGDVVRELLASETAACVCTWLVERALLREAGGFDEALQGPEDLDLALRLAACAPVLAVAQVLAKAREHPGRTTAGIADPHERMLRIYLRFLARERDPALRRVARRRCAEVLMDGARYEAAADRPARALRMLLRAIPHGPSPLAWARTLARVALNAVRRPRVPPVSASPPG